MKIEVPTGAGDSVVSLDNDPHVDCTFKIVYEGLTALAGSKITTSLEIQPPSTSTPDRTVVYTATQKLDHAGDTTFTVHAGDLNFLGTQANHTENGNNDSDKVDTADPNEITYHVQIDTFNGANPVDLNPKKKTFWIGGCEASPHIATQVSHEGQGTIGGTFTDTATLSDASTTLPTGFVTFQVFNNSNCTGPAVFTSKKPISGTTVTSDGFTPDAVGTYYWIASYGGDLNNNPVAGTCGDAGETLTIGKASPSIVTSVRPGATTNSFLDTATVTGHAPTGTVTFVLYGPGTDCSAVVAFTSTNDLINGTATSGTFTPTAAGGYHYIATYNGDANNKAVSGLCNASGESFTFTPNATQSGITTQFAAAAAPNKFTDTAKVTGGAGPNAPTGTVTFVVYGPDDATCKGPFVAIDPSSPVAADGTATSGLFTAPAAGRYTFIATYSGDANNTPAAGTCDSDGESFTVTMATPTITTTAMASTTTAGSFTDTATLAHVAAGHTPAGTMTFRVYGPNDPNCTGAAATLTPPSPVTGLSTTSGTFTPSGPGTYTFIASYSGDVFNSPVAGHCADAGESFTVTPPPPPPPPPPFVPPVVTVVLPSSATPAVTIVKTNDAGGNDFAKSNEAKQPFDSVDFRAVITNTSSEAETITAIADAWGGFTPAECPELIGTVLQPQTSVTCNFTIAGYSPVAGVSLTNTITVNVKDTANQVASATDTSTVTSPAAEATGGTKEQSVLPPAVLVTPAPTPAVVTPTPGAAVLPLTGSRTLPFTGANVWNMFLTGFGLLLTGLALWLKSYRVPGARHYA